MSEPIANVDVLCVGVAAYDLIFSVPHHPAPDEKSTATAYAECGGGPAANAAVTVARLGRSVAFAGYLGNDEFGERHLAELRHAGVATELVVRGDAPTPVSVALVKPGGARSLVAYRGDTGPLADRSVDWSRVRPKVILFDGHEPDLSVRLAERARGEGIPTILDAGSVHSGTETLVSRVSLLVCSERFACDFTGEAAPEAALAKLRANAPAVVVTLGERGLLWHRDERGGRLPALSVAAVDTTGAGDVFHGALAARVAIGDGWSDSLRYASAAAALACTRMGARLSIPTAAEVEELLRARAGPL
jgi:sulfofructose kinase